MPVKKRTAVIGVGNMGLNHVRTYEKISNLVAVCDSNKTIGKKIANQFQANYYTNHQEMIDKESLDAISIAVPTKHHLKIALDCITANIPCLIEKPIATTIEAANQIIKQAETRQLYIQIGHIERFNPAIKKVKQLIEKKRFGDIVNLLALRVGLLPPPTKNSDVVTDLSIHDIDIFNYLLGEFPIKASINKQKILSTNQSDTASIMLEYQSAVGLIQTNWITPIKMRKLYITGTTGFAELDYIKQKVTVYNRLHHIKSVSNFHELISKYDTSKKEVYISRKEPLNEELKYFLKNSRNNQPGLDTYQALQALKIALGEI